MQFMQSVSPQYFRKLLPQIAIFARVSPKQKVFTDILLRMNFTTSEKSSRKLSSIPLKVLDFAHSCVAMEQMTLEL